MKPRSWLSVLATSGLAVAVLTLPRGTTQPAFAYPPATGVLGKAKDCLVCHANNGPWKDDGKTIIDILDQSTKRSLKQADGGFLVQARRGEAKTVLTVIGRTSDDKTEAPYRNGWLYIDPTTIGTGSLSKFAPGWEVNLPMSCRVVGDALEGLEGAKVTVLPMTIRASDAAQDRRLVLQVMMTKGESVKGKPREGMISSYFERKVELRVID